MLERRFWSNFAFTFLVLIICLSIWQMRIGNSDSDSSNFVTFPIPTYTLNTINSTYSYPVDSLPFFDYNKLMDIANFKFKLLNECLSAPILLVLVHTSPKNIARRKSIRETWGRNRENLKVVFILGIVKDAKVKQKLEEENEKYKDFVQGTFIDTYRNMTYKHVTAFKYAIYHCPQAKYILKTDDDVFVNMPTMMDFLMIDLSPYGAKKLLSCTPLINSPVRRTYRSKWRVSFKEYREKYYPPYCPGWALLYSQDVLFALYKEVQNFNYFWIDDVLITGILTKKENIQHTNSESLVLPRKIMLKIDSKQSSYNNSMMFLYGPPNLTIKQIYVLWEFAKNHSISKFVLKDHT